MITKWMNIYEFTCLTFYEVLDPEPSQKYSNEKYLFYQAGDEFESERVIKNFFSTNE